LHCRAERAADRFAAQPSEPPPERLEMFLDELERPEMSEFIEEPTSASAAARVNEIIIVARRRVQTFSRSCSKTTLIFNLVCSPTVCLNFQNELRALTVSILIYGT
jgi:hypothetical protein